MNADERPAWHDPEQMILQLLSATRAEDWLPGRVLQLDDQMWKVVRYNERQNEVLLERVTA